MTLDEAIKHAEEVTEEKLYEYQECVAVHDTESATDCIKCGEEHRQLAVWLRVQNFVVRCINNHRSR